MQSENGPGAMHAAFMPSLGVTLGVTLGALGVGGGS